MESVPRHNEIREPSATKSLIVLAQESEGCPSSPGIDKVHLLLLSVSPVGRPAGSKNLISHYCVTVTKTRVQHNLIVIWQKYGAKRH